MCGCLMQNDAIDVFCRSKNRSTLGGVGAIRQHMSHPRGILSLAVDEDTDQVTPIKAGKPAGLGMLSLDDSCAELEQTYHISNQGTFVAGGIQINKAGVKGGSLAAAAAAAHNSKHMASPAKKHHEFGPEDILVLRTLGRGASGVVSLTLHLPSLSLLAQKTLGVFEQNVRHQFVKEMTAYMYAKSVDPQPELASLSASAIGGNARSTVGHQTLEASLASLNEGTAAALANLNVGGGRDAPSVPLISFFGASYEDGHISIFIEYMDSGSLQDIVDSTGPMPESVLRSVFRQATKGLQLVHQRRQVHRDIKPANLLLNHRGDVKLADFGIMAILDDADSLCKTFVGTTLYMSPERIRGEKYGYPGDIWSLGMSAIVCATGTSPFTASAASGGYFGLVQKVINEPSPVLTPAQGFSADFCDWIAKALIKDPAQRWTAEQLLAHPFLAAPDAGIDSKSWPPPFSSERVALNDADMDSVIQATAQYYYLRPGCPPYKGSLFEQARFERIGQQFGVDTRRVKKQFEAYLKTQQLTSGMGSLSIKE